MADNEHKDSSLDAQLFLMTRKQLRWQMIASIGVVLIFAVVLCSALVVVPKAVVTLSNIDRVSEQVMESIQDIDTMVAEITDASKNLNELVSDNAETLTGAVNDLAGIDFDGLNTAIGDLKDTVAPFASFFRKFK